MYVGPWQEYKLMRAINDVKAENEKLKSLMRSANGSTISTPRSVEHTGTFSSAIGSSSSVAARPSFGVSSVNRRTSSAARTKPKPLDRDALCATPTNSERSAQSAPTMSSHANYYSSDDPAMMSKYQAHPLVQELIRGAPMSHAQKEAQAGQPAFVRKVTGPLKENELEERLQRRTTLSLLYSGEPVPVPDLNEPPTRAAKPSILPSRRINNEKPKQRVPQQARGSSANQRNQALAASQKPSGMVNRNVVRDLASFYDRHIHEQQTMQQPPPSLHSQNSALVSSNVVPWEMPAFDMGLPAPSTHQYPTTASSHAALSSIPPPPVLPSNFGMGDFAPTFQRQEYAVASQHGNSYKVPVTSSAAALPIEIPAEQRRGAHLMGGNEASAQHMQRRPYDVGPPLPSGVVYYGGVQGGSSDRHRYAAERDDALSNTQSSLSSTNNHSKNHQAVRQQTVEDFVVSQDEDRLHQRAEDLLRASLDKGSSSKQKPTSMGAAQLPQGSSDMHRYVPPPPPTLPKDFQALFPGSLTSALPQSLAPDWQPSPKKPNSRQGAKPPNRPASMASDVSFDGEDVSELLQWANNLDTRDIWSKPRR